MHVVVFDQPLQELVLILVQDDIHTRSVEGEHPVVLLLPREIGGGTSTNFFTFSEKKVEFDSQLRQNLKKEIGTQPVVKARVPDDIAFLPQGGRVLNRVQMGDSKDLRTTVLVEVQTVRRDNTVAVLTEGVDG
jgi:hypothetical protein